MLGGMLINGVEFVETCQEPRSPRCSWALDSSRSFRTLLNTEPTDESQRVRCAAALLGYQRVQSEVVSATTRKWIERVTPHGYPAAIAAVPVILNSQYLYAASVNGEPLASRTMDVSSDGDATYEAGYRYLAEYRAFPYTVREDSEVLATAGVLSAGTPGGAAARPDEGDALKRGYASYSRYVTKMVEHGAKALTLPNGFTKFVKVAPETDPQPVPIGLPVPFFRSAVTYTWHLVPAAAVPDAAIARCANAVNDATFDGYAAETLLFSGFRLTPQQGPFGDRLFTVEYRFIYQPLQDFDGSTYTTRGWNYFPGVLSDKLRMRQITALQSGAAPANNAERIFKLQDFATLFRPDQS